MRHPSVALRMSVLLAGLGALVASCQSHAPVVTTDKDALSTMERIMLSANTCWFKSANPTFAKYQLAPELNSYTGRPRILIVDRGHPTGRPSLVVQAEGNPAKLEAFGPMMSGASAAQITGDVNRWANGNKGC
jgi:hypothetical protein